MHAMRREPRDLSEETGRQQAAVVSGEGEMCWPRAPSWARGEGVPDKATSCCFQLWLSTLHFENLSIYSEFCHVWNGLEFWRI